MSASPVVAKADREAPRSDQPGLKAQEVVARIIVRALIRKLQAAAQKETK